jgi:hypothetical protein
MKRAALMLAVAACGDLKGFSGDAPPLATIHVETTGDFEMVRTPGATDENLRVGLVWGTGWLPEPLCFLPPGTPELAATVAAGCRDPLSFTPTLVSASAPLTPDTPVDIPLDGLPTADVLFGDVTARVAYASLVVYDDRDGSGILELARSRRIMGGGFDPEGDDLFTADIVYGASFVSMSQPDQRVAFREGDFIETGFYPRHGCDAPPPAFSILGAGGFSFEDAAAATLAGVLPSEPPGSCSEAKPDDVTVEIPFRKPAEVVEVGCEQRRLDSTVRYRQPPGDPPPMFDMLPHACTGIPSLGEPDPATKDIVQLVIATNPGDTCKGLTHFTLIGCDEGRLSCDAPEWDFRANPPAWWPCPVTPP